MVSKLIFISCMLLVVMDGTLCSELSMKQELLSLQSAVSGLLARVDSLEEQGKLDKELIKQQQHDLDLLRSEVKVIRSESLSKDRLIKQMVSKVATLQSDTAAVSRSSRQSNDELAVAFCGKLNELVSDIGQNEIVLFNNILTNIGGPYDSSAGVFTAPVSGLYVFSTTVMIDQSDNTHLGLYINSQRKTSIKLYGTEHQYDTFSQTVVFYLDEEDKVSLRHYEGNKTLHGDYTMFTGFLLTKDYGQISGSGVGNIIG